jgi:fructan beta-fructosidase
MNTLKRKGAFFIVLGMFFVFFSCKKELNKEKPKKTSSKIQMTDSTSLYKETFRPQFHFTPPKKWMNDPNGLVFYKGIYHLFYQYYPKDIIWGPMHWGHATSKNLIHWKHKKIALYPDRLGLIFSGSAVIDTANTSGLGSLAAPPMVAIFTYHNMEIEKAGGLKTQSQGLAYSLDEGETWLKFNKNPIIENPNLKDFRDPKVFWNTDTKSWNLVLVAGNHAQFYSSNNLINWKLEGTFGKGIGAHGGVWECPDLFKLKVINSNEEKWVLLISINPGAPNGGSGTQYFIGDYNGKTFQTTQKEIKWMDYGTDNYAGVTYNNAPNDERIFIGWMSNWNYARNTPTKNWRSAMTLPRTLSIEKINNNYVLKNNPVTAIKRQYENAYSQAILALKSKQKTTLKYVNFNQSQIQFSSPRSSLKLVFSNENKDSLVLKYEAKSNLFSIDRTHSGMVAFEKSFGKKIHYTQTPNLNTQTIDYEIILDWSSIEVFLNRGIYSFTEQIFPKKRYTQLTLVATENMNLKDLRINKIKSIWDKKEPSKKN